MTSMALGAELSPFDLIHLVSRRKYYVREKPRHFFEFFFHKRAITNALELNLKEAALLSAQVSKETTLITVSKRLKQLKLIIITENSLENFVNKSSVRWKLSAFVYESFILASQSTLHLSEQVFHLLFFLFHFHSTPTIPNWERSRITYLHQQQAFREFALDLMPS